MSRRVNVLAVLIVLGTSVPNVPIVFSEDDGSGSLAQDPSVPTIEVYPSAATVVAGESMKFIIKGEIENGDRIQWGIRENKGEITDGWYTAPDDPGVYHVTAIFLPIDRPHYGNPQYGCGASEADMSAATMAPASQEPGFSEATVTVRAASFRIVPAWATAGTQTTVFFDTTSNVGSNEDVRWELVEEESGGSLHVSGLVGAPKIAEYTTPPVAGMYHLRAIRKDRTEMKASVAVTVSTDP